MRRREFITLLGGAAAAWPLAARAQQPERMRRVGVLMGSTNDAEGQARITAFRQGMQAQGWIEGSSVRIDERWADGEPASVLAHASELVRLKPDVILGTGSRVWVALQRQTATIPIVSVGVPMALMKNIARPAGNVTGFTIFEHTLVSKLLDTLKEAAPHVARVAMLIHPDHPSIVEYSSTFESAANLLRIRPIVAQVSNRDAIERSLHELAREANSGVLVPAEVFIAAHRELVLTLAAHHRLPSVSPYRSFVSSGALISYGPDTSDVYRRAATYVDRILRGERPADLPVQTPTKYQLVINLKTAKAFGLDVPPMLLARADEVIE
jgi:putative tryptophan/tyrosine transport system substrate-binding protein